MSNLDEKICKVEISSIFMNPFQPRRHFSKEELADLAASIKEVGLIHPPVVRQLGDGKYELLAGERRLRASELVGFKSIPVLIRNCSEVISAEAALIENIQRVDLNALEVANALKRLSESFRWTQEELAQKIGKKRSTVANYLRLLSLPASIQESLSKNFITMGHAKAILSLNDANKQQQLHEKIIQEGLSVREAEAFALNLLSPQKKEFASEKSSRNVFLDELARKMREKLGTNVVIEGDNEQGVVKIDYYSTEDLEMLDALLGEESCSVSI